MNVTQHTVRMEVDLLLNNNLELILETSLEQSVEAKLGKGGKMSNQTQKIK